MLKLCQMFVLSLLLTACATAPDPIESPQLQVTVASSPAVRHIAPRVKPMAPVITRKAITLKALPQASVNKPPVKTITGKAAVSLANQAATREPNTIDYHNAIMTFAYSPGGVYRVYCAPLYVTDIALEAGEHVISVAAGDTLRWQVSKTYSGQGGEYQAHLLIKPTDSDIHNSMVITTDRRTYHLSLTATDQTAMAVVRWQYAEKKMLKPASKSVSQQPAVMDQKIKYSLEHIHADTAPVWQPLRVFSDGQKTYVEFSNKAQVLPVLFSGDEKHPVLINYRVQGHFYVIDRVMGDMQLRLSSAGNAIVLIKRHDHE